jgi:progressive ankylosis protein
MKQRDIFFFWLPLAFSWLLMTVEGPWVQGVISRKPDAETQLAAFGLVMSLSITIEAPVIMLLATSNALARDRQSYRVLWRYMMIVNLLVTLIAGLMAFTPLLDLWLGDMLGVPQNIIDATRPAMAIMILWSAFIGFRRFFQGILITYNHTRMVGQGTVVRIIASAGIAIGLGLWSNLSGAVIGAYALIFAVLGEMLFIYWRAKPDTDTLLQKERGSHRPAITYGTVLRFHIPLALTSLMTLLIRPVVEKGLAGTDNAEHALAAWSVVFSILLLTRSAGMSWQEVVITMSRGEDEMRALRRFTWRLGLATTGFLALAAWTPIIDVYLGNILEIPESLRDMVVTGARVGFLIPLLTTLQSYLRATLMRSENTSSIYQGMFIGLLVTAGSMWGGIEMGIDGILMASLALTLGTLVEMLFLLWAYRGSHERLTQTWQQEAIYAAGD